MSHFIVSYQGQMVWRSFIKSPSHVSTIPVGCRKLNHKMSFESLILATHFLCTGELMEDDRRGEINLITGEWVKGPLFHFNNGILMWTVDIAHNILMVIIAMCVGSELYEMEWMRACQWINYPFYSWSDIILAGTEQFYSLASNQTSNCQAKVKVQNQSQVSVIV